MVTKIQYFYHYNIIIKYVIYMYIYVNTLHNRINILYIN